MTLLDDLLDSARLSKTFLLSLGLLLLSGYFASGLYSVKPDQRGVVKRFGHVIRDNVKPGMHFRLPWPIDAVETLPVTEVKTHTISFGVADSGGSRRSALVTGDKNLMVLALRLQYLIAEPGRYGTALTAPIRVLDQLARHQAILQLSAMQVDQALTTGRQSIQRQIRTALQNELARLGSGIQLASVQFQTIEPPRKIAAAFTAVNTAREDRRRLVREAEGDRDRRLIKARSEAESMVQEAQAGAKEAEEIALGDAERFLAVWQEYRHSKEITAYRIYFETLERVLPRVRMVVASPSAELNRGTSEDSSRSHIWQHAEARRK